MEKRINKTISVIAAIACLMNLTYLQVSIAANEDYVRGDKPANVIPDVTSNGGFTYFCINNNTTLDYTLDYGRQVKWSIGEDADQFIPEAWQGFSGFELGDRSGAWNFAPVGGKTYVIAMKVKNTSSNGITPYFGAAMNNTWSESNACYTNEYGRTGMAVDSTDWKDFKATITLPASYNCEQAYGKKVFFGLNKEMPSGVGFNVDVSSADSAYLAEEKAYDISVKAEGDTVLVNQNSISLSAEVVNQIGIEGSLSQNFEWYALNRDRTDYVSGITFTQGANSAQVTASWGDDLANGEYVLAAKSPAYGFVKSVTIIVTDNFLDDKNAASTPSNVIPDVTSSGGYTYFCINNNATLDYSLTYGNQVKWGVRDGSDHFVPDAWQGFSGFEFGERGGTWPFSPVGGKTYVIAMKVKNTSSNGITPYFGAAMNNTWSESGAVYTNEYRKAGMAVDSTDWKDFKATITLPADYNCEQAYGKKVFFGMNKEMATGVGFAVDVSSADSAYLAEESAQRVALSCGKVGALTPGTVIDVSAQVLNQIGITGTLSQELDWYCVSDDGGRAVNGIEITKQAGGAKVTVNSVDEGSGPVKIVAVSEKYGLITCINPLISEGEKRTLHVSPYGSDTAGGTANRPLATLNGARNKIRTLLKDNGSTMAFDVIFDGGTYYFDNTVDFTSEDSGTAENQVTYKAADGEKVVFSGGVNLDLSSAANVTDGAVLSRLKAGVRDKVVEIDLNKQNFPYNMSGEQIQATISELYGNYEHPGLYLDGNEQLLSQWPNGDAEYTNFEYDGSGAAAANNRIVYQDDEPSAWTNAQNWWVGGYINYDYCYTRMPALSVDAGSKKITLGVNTNLSGLYVDDPSDTSSTPTSKRWKAFNLLEEIDTPTEWYLDKDTMKLYYYMPEVRKDSKLELSVLKTAMINLTQTEHIGFENIDFENTRGNAMSATDVDSITVKGCTFNNIGVDGFAVYGTVNATSDKNYWQVQKLDAAYNCEVSDCKFNNIGGHAVLMDGGNVDTLTPGNNVVENSIFFKCSQKIKNFGAIVIKGCGNIVEHNNISRCAFQAIIHYGNDHKIQYNEIHDVIQETDDVGAIYGGRNTIQRGTEISYNYLHDLQGTYDAIFGHKPAIYWDDMQTGMKAQYNIIKNAKINVYTNGVDNTFIYNTSIDITKTNLDIRNGGAASNSNTETAAFSGTIANPTLYYNKYPNLQSIVQSSDRKDRTLAQYNILKGNLCVNGPGGNGIGTYTMNPIKGGFLNLQWVSAGNVAGNTDSGSTSYFVDAANQDYRVLKSSPVGSTGVLNEDFDINLIGVQGDNTIAGSAIELVSPYNKENTNSNAIHLMWNDSFGATKYTVTVATDAEFKNIAAVKDVYYDFADISPLPCDGTDYYWKVTAHNTSREFHSDWESAVYTFTNGEKISAIAHLANDNTLTLSITNNYYQDGKAAAIYLTEYDIDGKLSAIQMWHKTLTYQTPFADEAVALKNPGKAASVKLFIWDEEHRPLKDLITIK